jgi:hypothetical protein
MGLIVLVERLLFDVFWKLKVGHVLSSRALLCRSDELVREDCHC